MSQEANAIRQWDFGQLREYKMGNIFREKFTRNEAEKLFPDPSLKNQNWVYLWIISLKVHTVCLYCIPSWGLSKYIDTK